MLARPSITSMMTVMTKRFSLSSNVSRPPSLPGLAPKEEEAGSVSILPSTPAAPANRADRRRSKHSGKTDQPKGQRKPGRLSEGRSCADLVERAMLRPGQWWEDLKASADEVDIALKRAGKLPGLERARESLRQAKAALDENRDAGREEELQKAYDAARRNLRSTEKARVTGEGQRGLRRSYRSMLVDDSEPERRRIAARLKTIERFSVPREMIQKAFDEGLFSDPSQLSALIKAASLGDREAVFFEFAFVPEAGAENGRQGHTGFLVERLHPEDPGKWAVSVFAVDPDGFVQARPFVSIMATDGETVGWLPEPYTTFLPRLKGMPHSFFYSGLGKLDNEEGLPSFAVPEGFEDSCVLSILPLYQDTVGRLLDQVDSNITFGQRPFDRGFMRSVAENAGHLQCVLLGLATLARLGGTATPGGQTVSLEPLLSGGSISERVNHPGHQAEEAVRRWVRTNGRPLDGSEMTPPNEEHLQLPITLADSDDDEDMGTPTSPGLLQKLVASVGRIVGQSR